MVFETPFWNKVDEDKLTIEIQDENDKVFVKVYTNDINIMNKKIEVVDKPEVKDTLNKILDSAEQVKQEFLNAEETQDYTEFKNKSQKLMEEIKLI
jgi:hypothetical protein